MHIKNALWGLSGLSLIPLVAACASSASPTSSTDETPHGEPNYVSLNAAGEPQYDRTVVYLHEDGTQTVYHNLVTAAEEKEEQATRVALRNGQVPVLERTTVQDPNCATSDVALFNNSSDDCSYTSSPEICFYGVGSAPDINLANYKYCTYRCILEYEWAGNVAQADNGNNEAVLENYAADTAVMTLTTAYTCAVPGPLQADITGLWIEQAY